MDNTESTGIFEPGLYIIKDDPENREMTLLISEKIRKDDKEDVPYFGIVSETNLPNLLEKLKDVTPNHDDYHLYEEFLTEGINHCYKISLYCDLLL